MTAGSLLKNRSHATDGLGVEDAGTSSHRRMGQILADRGFITPDQLAEALRSQEQTGRLLGEICVEKWGLDRFALADALGEQWVEIEHGVEIQHGVEIEQSHDRPAIAGLAVDTTSFSPDLKELCALLAETVSAHARLHSRTEDLERRLAALETFVAGIGAPLAEPRSVYPA